MTCGPMTPNYTALRNHLGARHPIHSRVNINACRQLLTGAAFRVDSATYFAQFAFRVCIRGTSEASLKWPMVQSMRIVLLIANGSTLWRLPVLKKPSASQSCSFNCKWWPPYVGCHFLGGTVFRVRRRIKFIRNVLEVVP